VNLIHRMYCRSGRWRAQLSQLLPWATAGTPLRGATVLELGKRSWPNDRLAPPSSRCSGHGGV
jgi:hypothetical protein